VFIMTQPSTSPPVFIPPFQPEAAAPAQAVQPIQTVTVGLTPAPLPEPLVAQVAAPPPEPMRAPPPEAMRVPLPTPLTAAVPAAALHQERPPRVPRRRLLPRQVAERQLAGVTARCSLHWSAWLALVPFAAVTLLVSTSSARARGMGTGAAVGHVLASAVWGLGAALAVAWVAWRVRGQKRTVATVAFVAALSLISLAGAGATVSRGASESSTIKALRARASGEASQAARRSDSSVDHAFDCLRADGGLSLRGVSDIAQLDRRLGLFDDVLRAVREAREAAEAVQAKFQLDLAAAGVLPARREQALAEFRSEVRWDDNVKIIDATERVLAAGRNELRFVRQEWGRVKVNRENGQCVFQDKRANERFKKLVVEVLTANAALRACAPGAKAPQATAAAGVKHELMPN
jgi:hypothetical protein